MKRFAWLSLLLAAGVVVAAGVGVLLNRPPGPAGPYTPSGADVVQMVFGPNATRPHLVTRGGGLYLAAADGWQRALPAETVYDLYSEFNGTLYAGTATGLLRLRDGAWQVVPGIPPTQDVEAMHGFVFAMGVVDGVQRATQGAAEDTSWRRLTMPAPAATSRGFVMLGDHSHVTLNDGPVLTHDMGLSWERVAAPEPVRLAAADDQGRLLAVTDGGLYRWNYQDATWTALADLPNGVPPIALHLFGGALYALADVRLFRLHDGVWEQVIVAGDPGRALTALAVHRRDALWVADAVTGLLWRSSDPALQTWELLSFTPGS
ncbi:MAG: hypothetical protein MUE40_11290 [Anaerolineae bacterium]|nr:hypothetical protein [Anaerolineae bacterium]